HEGFGRIVFNHPVYRNGTDHAPDPLWLEEDWMRLREAGFASEFELEADFRRRWLDVLESMDTGAFREERWGAVARWLRRESAATVGALSERLEELGKPANLPVAGQGREKPNVFGVPGKEGRAKGIGILREALGR